MTDKIRKWLVGISGFFVFNERIGNEGIRFLLCRLRDDESDIPAAAVHIHYIEFTNRRNIAP